MSSLWVGGDPSAKTNQQGQVKYILWSLLQSDLCLCYLFKNLSIFCLFLTFLMVFWGFLFLRTSPFLAGYLWETHQVVSIGSFQHQMIQEWEVRKQGSLGSGQSGLWTGKQKAYYLNSWGDVMSATIYLIYRKAEPHWIWGSLGLCVQFAAVRYSSKHFIKFTADITIVSFINNDDVSEKRKKG